MSAAALAPSLSLRCGRQSSISPDHGPRAMGIATAAITAGRLSPAAERFAWTAIVGRASADRAKSRTRMIQPRPRGACLLLTQGTAGPRRAAPGFRKRAIYHVREHRSRRRWVRSWQLTSIR